MRLGIAAGLLIALHGPVLAEPEDICRARWVTADVDANGALDPKIDKPEYVQALAVNAPISRDDFLKLCQSGALASLPLPSNPAENRDLGKGDITPGPALSKDVALKKLKASGFGDVADLTLDDTGVWRGTAVANGKTVPVAVDPQGDIVAN
jgi:hypothetical protein